MTPLTGTEYLHQKYPLTTKVGGLLVITRLCNPTQGGRTRWITQITRTNTARGGWGNEVFKSFPQVDSTLAAMDTHTMAILEAGAVMGGGSR